MGDVLPDRVTRWAWAVRKLAQGFSTKTALSLRVGEFPKDRLLNNVLELFEDLIGGFVHQSKTLWHRSGSHHSQLKPKSFRPRLIALWRFCVRVFGFFWN
jgi:hypothetical protein